MKIIAQNKKARFDYEILEELEAGVVLTGAEIKSIRQGKVNLKGSYVGASVHKNTGGLYVKQMHITKYAQTDTPQNPLRDRKLLLHKKEILRIFSKTTEKGMAVIPLKLYLKKGYAKLLLGIGKGKKQYDKRRTLKKKAETMEVKQALKRTGRV